MMSDEEDKKDAEFCRLCKTVLDYMRAKLDEDEIILFTRNSATVLRKNLFVDFAEFYKNYPLKGLGLVDGQ